jgi:hypothetical protein
MGKQMVVQRSAVREGNSMIYLLTDHSGLNKFSGDEDPNFRSVCAKVEKLAKEASSIVQQNFDGMRNIRIVSMFNISDF